MARHASQPRLTTNPFGYYEIRWTDNGRSKRVSTGTQDSDKAQALFADWLHERLIPSTHTKDWTIAQLLDLYWRERAHKKLSAERTEGISRLLRSAFGKLYPSHLTADRIAGYIKQRANGGHSGRTAVESTVRRELKTLVAALNHGVRQRRIAGDSFPHIELPPDGKARTVIIPDEHLDLMIEQAGERLRRFIIIATETASRKRAIETLTWKQVDMKNQIIHFMDDTVRTVKRRVSVPMSPDLYDYMVQWHAPVQHDLEWVTGASSSLSHAWTTLMQKLATDTGEDVYLDYVPHDLRRTWATNAARAGVDLWQIAGVLGDSIAVVTKYYAHHCPKHLRDAVNYRKVTAQPGGSDAARETSVVPALRQSPSPLSSQDSARGDTHGSAPPCGAAA